jgi:hypothetical protein
MNEHHSMIELMAADDAWTPHPMDRAQAEQGMAQREHDEDLRRILSDVWTIACCHAPMNEQLSTMDFTTLCAAVGVDIRDVT